MGSEIEYCDPVDMTIVYCFCDDENGKTVLKKVLFEDETDARLFAKRYKEDSGLPAHVNQWRWLVKIQS